MNQVGGIRHYTLAKKDNNIVVSTAAQFYCAPQDTFIGSISFPEGFYINEGIQFFGFDAEAEIMISSDKGIAFKAEMDPIIIGNKSLFSITAKKKMAALLFHYLPLPSLRKNPSSGLLTFISMDS